MSLNLFDSVDCVFLTLSMVLLLFIGFKKVFGNEPPQLFISGMLSGILIALFNIPNVYVNLQSQDFNLLMNLATLLYMVLLGFMFNKTYLMRSNLLFLIIATVIYLSVQSKFKVEYLLIWLICLFILQLIVKPALSYLFLVVNDESNILIILVFAVVLFGVICGFLRIPQVLGAFYLE